jgi:Uma2 family endonuclease
MSTTATLLTFAEFEQLPDCPGKQELIDGQLIKMPPPLKNHTLTAKAIAKLLSDAVGDQWVNIEAGFLIGGRQWLQPDVSVLWPHQQEAGGYWAGAPMVAIEILSEHKSAQYVEDKLNLYFDDGAREVWTVSRRRRTITVYRKTSSGDLTSLRYTDSFQPEWLSVPVRPADLIVP